MQLSESSKLKIKSEDHYLEKDIGEMGEKDAGDVLLGFEQF